LFKLGKVGKFSDMLNREYPVWRAVDAGIPLSEVQTWDLEELDLFMAYLDHKRDMEVVITEALREKHD